MFSDCMIFSSLLEDFSDMYEEVLFSPI